MLHSSFFFFFFFISKKLNCFFFFFELSNIVIIDHKQQSSSKFKAKNSASSKFVSFHWKLKASINIRMFSDKLAQVTEQQEYEMRNYISPKLPSEPNKIWQALITMLQYLIVKLNKWMQRTYRGELLLSLIEFITI